MISPNNIPLKVQVKFQMKDKFSFNFAKIGNEKTFQNNNSKNLADQVLYTEESGKYSSKGGGVDQGQSMIQFPQKQSDLIKKKYNIIKSYSTSLLQIDKKDMLDNYKYLQKNLDRRLQLLVYKNQKKQNNNNSFSNNSQINNMYQISCREETQQNNVQNIIQEIPNSLDSPKSQDVIKKMEQQINSDKNRKIDNKIKKKQITYKKKAPSYQEQKENYRRSIVDLKLPPIQNKPSIYDNKQKGFIFSSQHIKKIDFQNHFLFNGNTIHNLNQNSSKFQSLNNSINYQLIVPGNNLLTTQQNTKKSNSKRNDNSKRDRIIIDFSNEVIAANNLNLDTQFQLQPSHQQSDMMPSLGKTQQEQ